MMNDFIEVSYKKKKSDSRSRSRSYTLRKYLNEDNIPINNNYLSINRYYIPSLNNTNSENSNNNGNKAKISNYGYYHNYKDHLKKYHHLYHNNNNRNSNNSSSGYSNNVDNKAYEILFGLQINEWLYDRNKLYYVTPYYISVQICKLTRNIYGSSGLLWDMFGGIGVDGVSFSQYYNVIITEISSIIFRLLYLNTHRISNINLMNINAMSLIHILKPDYIYFDPPWGNNYRTNIHDFDFNYVYIDYPDFDNFNNPSFNYISSYKYQTLLHNDCEDNNNKYLPKRLRCTDLLVYLYKNVCKNIIIKSPYNSNSFEKLFRNKIRYVQEFSTKNLKFIFI